MTQALVIEDNEDNMVLIRFILEKNGYQTIAAEDGKTGIDMAIKEKPDCIILDIQLPDMNGLEVLKAIRASGANGDTAIIAMTSFAMSGDRERFMQAGCTGYIEKPIDPETVMAEINAVLGESAP